MYPDQEFETNFGSDILNSECILPSEPSTGNATELRPGDVDLKALLQGLVFKVEYLSRKVACLTSHERRFDNIDRELMRQGRLERIEQDMGKLLQNTSTLNADLKGFSMSLASRIKQIEVHPEQKI
ncbi:unnamed protein product [Discula destructiva]